MPITPFLNGEPFDPESRRVLRVALEMVCIALRTGDCDEGVQQAIAKKLIALVKAGERNPDILCEEALKDIRQPQQWAASEAARSSVLGKQKLGWEHGTGGSVASAAPVHPPTKARGPEPRHNSRPVAGFSLGANGSGLPQRAGRRAVVRTILPN